MNHNLLYLILFLCGRNSLHQGSQDTYKKLAITEFIHTKTVDRIKGYIHRTKIFTYVTKTRANLTTYSSVPNRRVGRNKRAGGKILKKL